MQVAILMRMSFSTTYAFVWYLYYIYLWYYNVCTAHKNHSFHINVCMLIFMMFHIHQCSMSLREVFSITQRLSLKYANFVLDRGLVRISAIYPFVDMYWSFTTPFCTISLMKWYLISICFNLSWNNVIFKSLIHL